MGNRIEIRGFCGKGAGCVCQADRGADSEQGTGPDEGLFIAESPKVVMRALDAGYEPVSILTEDRHINVGGAGGACQMPGYPCVYGSFEVLTQLTGYKLTRGLLCAMRRRDLPRARGTVQGTHAASLSWKMS